MKRLLVFLCVMFLVFGALGVANATLWDRGGGLIYDSDQDITWLQDTNYAQTSGFDPDGLMTWDNAVAWADQLVYGGYDDWRLPSTVDGPYVLGYDGSTTAGYNITSSEIGYMYYVQLGNLAYYATDGTYPQPGWGLTNTSFNSGGPGGPSVSFQNLTPTIYWSGTEYGSNPNAVWHNRFGYGTQSVGSKSAVNPAWAVRPGDSAPIPEPASMLLLGSGLIGLAGFRRKFKK